jgi:hypothetical protein
VIPRRLVFGLAVALCVVGAARPADAAPRPRHNPHRISAVTLTPEGAGTLIRITYAGGPNRHIHVLRSPEPLEALAVADVDNDGYMDILAAREGGGLVLWHNAGRGRFVVATAARAHAPTRRETAFQRVLATNAPIQCGDDRYTAALARAPDAAASLHEIRHVTRPSTLILSAFSACSQGRAPPPLA